MAYNFEGVGPPRIVFDTGLGHVLPEPNGSGRDGLRIYDFKEFSRGKYWSESNKKIIIGRKFIFTANLKWISLPKLSLKYLWDAQKRGPFDFILNVDNLDITFKVEVEDLNWEYFKGMMEHPAGYSANLKLEGTELLSSPGYTAIFSEDGYGSNWGGNTENQSP